MAPFDFPARRSISLRRVFPRKEDRYANGYHVSRETLIINKLENFEERRYERTEYVYPYGYQLKSKTVSAAGIEVTYEIRVEKSEAFLNKINAVAGVQDAALVAYTGESA